MKKIFILSCLLFAIFSCKMRKPDSNALEIELPETKMPANITQWAINKYPFIKLREEPTEDSKILYYLPIGGMLKILKKENELTSFDNQGNYWYYIDYEGERGWLFGSFIEIFNSYEEAFRRSEEIILGDKK